MTTIETCPVTHPAWCHQGVHCSARPKDDAGFLLGTHRRAVHHLDTIWGSTIRLYLVQDGSERFYAERDADHAPPTTRVGFVVLAHEDDVPEDLRDTIGESDWRRDNGERIDLEPEEARMLARFLVEAADERDRLG